MGRPQQTQPQVPVEFVQECFDLRDGCLVWRERPVDHFPHRVDDHQRFNGQRAGSEAGYPGPDGRLMVQFTYGGHTRRIAASRIAWCLSSGEWPRGQVRARDGDENNLRPANLIVTQRGKNPAAIGTSSLARRRAVDAKLIEALASHPDASVARLAELAGLTESGACARLGTLAAKGLAASPMCIPGRAWALTAKGQAVATGERPLIDDLDRKVLAALALTSMGSVKLARRVEICPPTIRRRARLLVERGLVFGDPRKFYTLTQQGRQAVGDDMPVRQPWIDPRVISAATARDVLSRSPNDDRTKAFRSRISSIGAAKSIEAQRLHKREGFHTLSEFDRMTG
jgi:hypothetical protein